MPLSQALPSQMTGRQVHDGAGTRDPAGAWKVFGSSDKRRPPTRWSFSTRVRSTATVRISRHRLKVGDAREVEIFGMSGTEEGQDSTESAWLTPP
jgi:hypothetical protein